MEDKERVRLCTGYGVECLKIHETAVLRKIFGSN
jgi:hypothetical protein